MASSSKNTTAILTRHYRRVIPRWPQDTLQRAANFRLFLDFRLDRVPSLTTQQQQTEMRNLNAIYCLLDDRYSKKYHLPDHFLRPDSNPAYYEKLMKDIEEIPTRTPTEAWWLWLKGKIRFS